MYELLKYSDEIDKSLGMAGMAIALLACDGEDCVASISIEDGDTAFEFTPDAFFIANPRLSAKIAWQQMIREYNIFSGMIIGNILCRHIVANKNIRQELIEIIHNLISEYGIQNYSFEEDEVESIFNKDLKYFQRLFNHPTVFDVARDFASNLRIQRRMTAGDIFENLSRLSSI